MIFHPFLVSAAVVAAFWFYLRVRAIRDVPELMRILWEKDHRCLYPARRSETRLWLDAREGFDTRRLRAAAKEAARAGLVKRTLVKGLIGEDFFVSIAPRVVGRYWAEPVLGDPWYVFEDGGQWKDADPAPWLSSFGNHANKPPLN